MHLISLQKSRIMNRCYGDTNVVITSQVVQDLGAMVTKLPIDRLETVSAADLGQTVESIKEDYQATKSKRKRDPRRKAIARTIAKKVKLELNWSCFLFILISSLWYNIPYI